MNIKTSSLLRRVRSVRPGKSWLILAIALASGGLAALAARAYLNNEMSAIEARSKNGVQNLVVAKIDLAKGAKLSSENMAIRAIPADFAQSTAVTPEQFERANGQTLAWPLKAGEMVFWGLLETQKPPSFSSRVEAGHRAITVPVDEINSISGMLEPGDVIDLVASLDQKGKKLTFPLLQNMQVMATGQRSVDDPASGEKRQFSTVTLNTTPEEAQNLIVARELGKLTALLRNPQDKNLVASGSTDLNALLGLPGALNNSGGGAVTVLTSTNLARLPPEALHLNQGGLHDSTANDETQARIGAPPPHPVRTAPAVKAARNP